MKARNLTANILYRLAGTLPPFDVYGPWQSLMQSQWWSAEHLLELQRERLSSILNHALHNVQIYRSRTSRELLKTLERDPVKALQQIFPVNRDELFDASEDERNARNVSPFGAVTVRTSGTGGQKRLSLRIDRKALLQKYALLLRNYSNMGWQAGDAICALWNLAHEAYQPGAFSPIRSAAETVFHHKRYLPPMPQEGLWEEAAQEVAQQLANMKPTLIEGDGNYLGRIAEAMQREDIAAPGDLKTVRLATCPSALEARKKMENVFGCQVLDDYGPRETEGVGLECSEHSGLHLSSESYYLEVLNSDASKTPEGEIGELVLTDLDNRLQPLVRYRTGDMIRAGSGKCSCRRGLPLVGHIEGRLMDSIKTDKGYFTPMRMMEMLSEFDLENRARMVRRAKKNIRLEISPYRRDKQLEKKLEKQFSAELDSGYKVSVSFVPTIELSRSGKMRYLVDENI